MHATPCAVRSNKKKPPVFKTEGFVFLPTAIPGFRYYSGGTSLNASVTSIPRLA